MQFLLTIEGLIGVSFLVSLIITLFFRFPAVKGCLIVGVVPIAAAVIFWLRLELLPSDMLSSTSILDVPFAFIWACCGALPGFLAGLAINAKRTRQ